MGKASVPKRGRSAKSRPLRSDRQAKGMPTIVLGKKKIKLQTKVVKKKINIKSKCIPKVKQAPENEDADNSSVTSRARRNAGESEAGSSKTVNELEKKGLKREKSQKSSARSESPATTRLSRSSSASSFVGKTSEGKKIGKGNAEKGKGKSPVPAPAKNLQESIFKKNSPPSKVQSGSSKSKDVAVISKGKSETEGSTSKKGVKTPVNSSPESVLSGSSQSKQVPSDSFEDELSVLDDDESCIGSHSEDLDIPNGEEETLNEPNSKPVNGSDGGQKFIPKLTKKNINELFPSDDSASRLRSGSPASQKSTRSLTLQRNSPQAKVSSSLSFSSRSESGVRVLRNGTLKRSTVTGNLLLGTKKKKRVYAGMIKDEDKIEDSRSDFSDEQSSIFSESDSSNFLEAFSRMKNNELDDDEDVGLGKVNSSVPQVSPLEKAVNPSLEEKTVRDSPVESVPCENSADSEKKSSQPPKNNDILNNIQSDWDSDGEAIEEETDGWIPKSPKEGHSAFDELLSNSSSLPNLNDKESSNDSKSLEKSEPAENNCESTDKSEERQDSESNPTSPLDLLDESSSPDQLSTELDNQSSSQDNSSNSQSKMPEPIVLKTNENKNGFATSVDFVANKNKRIDFELLRRRTKRSMSFNMELPEKNPSQRILAVEPDKLHGKASLVWTVKAVREPIIPKSVTSPEKALTKPAQEGKNISPVKPMMESSQNDNQSTPKASTDVFPTSSVSGSSSSVKENILVQKSPKQSPGRSPVIDLGLTTFKTVSTSPAQVTSESMNDGSSNGIPESRDKSVLSNGILGSASDSSLAATVKKPSSAVEEASLMTPKAGTVASQSSIEDNISLGTAATPITDKMEIDPVAPPLASELSTQADEAAKERCSTPNSKNPSTEKEVILSSSKSSAVVEDGALTPGKLSSVEEDILLTPGRSSTDDGESFCLRLSPTPTKDENRWPKRCSGSTTPAKGSSSPDRIEPLPGDETEEPNSEGVKSQDETLNDIIKDLEEKLPEESNNIKLTPSEETSSETSTKPENPTLQLIRKKGISRPRSLSADCSLSTLSFMKDDDTWVVKNDSDSSILREERKETSPKEDKSSEKSQIVQENVPGPDTVEKLEVSTNLETPDVGLEADVKNDSSSNMTIECPTVQVKQPGLLSPRLEADVERLNFKLNDIEKKRREITEEEQSPEKKAIKEWVLSSLGLQSVAAAAAAAASGAGRPTKRRSQDGLVPSSGRLKAVIKVPKDNKRDKKGDRKPLRMVFKNGKFHTGGIEDMPGNVESDSSFRLEGNSVSDLSVASMSSGLDCVANGDVLASTSEADEKAKTGTNLVIPEKSSSFSIHPGRLCSDVCSYCFGKFGSLDTPCHVAQLKSRERQMKIMSVETHLALDSCLCDACIRYVDRKANCPSAKPQTSHRKEGKGKFEGSMATCSVTGCVQPARHSLRKKWYIKIKKSVMKKCPIDLELAHQHLPLPLCPEHFSYLEYFMVCGLCKRRLSRGHMYNLNNTSEINICLEHDGIPARLSDKLFVCKLCRYYATLRVKHPGSHFNLSSNQREFCTSYRRKILRNHDIEVSESEEEGEDGSNDDANQDEGASVSGASSSTLCTPSSSTDDNLSKGKRKRSGSNATASSEPTDSGDMPKKKSRHSDQFSKPKDSSKNAGRSREREGVPPVTISMSELNQSKGLKTGKSKGKEDSESSAMEWVRKGLPPFYPGEDELALHAKFQFDDKPSADRVWEKCTSSLQFDKETKKLWQELARPYGSQSSFLRHLVLMERYWREGELVLGPQASAKAQSYTRSVQNRLKAYGSDISVKATPQPQPQPQKPPVALTQPPSTLTVRPTPPPPAVAPLVATVPAAPAKDLALALTGGTVLTAAAAAAAVTAVHLPPLPSPSPSPSGSGDSLASWHRQAQPKPPAAKSQGKGPQGKGTGRGKGRPKKSQHTQQSQPVVQVKPTSVLQPTQASPSAPPSTLRMMISKPPAPIQDLPPAVKQQVAISLEGHPAMTISAPVSVASGITITPEPSMKIVGDKPPSVPGKLPLILPKLPVSAVTSKQATSSFGIVPRMISTSSPSPVSSRPQFMPLSSAPVVNLTRSISLTAVPSSPPSVPDLHPINPARPNRSPSASLPQTSSSITVSTSRSSSGTYVSIIPTSPSKAVYPRPSTPSLNKPASITPIYTSQSLPSPVSVTSSSVVSNMSLSPPSVMSNDSRAAPSAGKVHVTAGGKSFSLTIQQFKKLQALRQQRQLEQQSKLKRQSAKQLKERRVSSTAVASTGSQKDDLEVVEVRDVDSDVQQSSLPTISAVVSGDQAKAMWNDESRTSENDSNLSISVTSPMVDISPILEGKSDMTVENMPKIPKALTVTQIRKESPPFSKTLSTSGISLTITRQKCQTPLTPQMSSPALDIFPS